MVAFLSGLDLSFRVLEILGTKRSKSYTTAVICRINSCVHRGGQDQDMQCTSDPQWPSAAATHHVLDPEDTTYVILLPVQCIQLT